MPVTIDWTIKGYVIFIRYSGDITMDDVREVRDRVVEMRDSTPGDHFIHHIAEIDNAGTYPKSLGEIASVARPFLTHPRMGYTVVVNLSNPFARFLAEMLAKFTRMRYRSVSTFDDALSFLHSVDTSITHQSEPLYPA